MSKVSVRDHLSATYSELRRKGQLVTVTLLAKESGVARGVIYRDHRDIVDLVLRDRSPKKLEEVEVLRLKIEKLKRLLNEERLFAKDMSALCAHLLSNLKLERERVERLEVRLNKVGSIKKS